MRALILLAVAACGLALVPAASAVGDADLEAGLTIVGTNIAMGQSAYYNATITNRGPGEANNARLTFPLPANTELRWARPSIGSCSGERTITCRFGLLHAGYTVSVDIGVLAREPGALDVSIGVESDTSDPDNINSHTRVSGHVRDRTADLATTIDGPATVLLGENAEYTVTVSNAGPDRSREASFRSELAGPATLISMTPSQGSCGDLKCSLGKIEAGEKATVKIVLKPTAAGELVQTAIVSGIDVDTDAANQATAHGTRVRSRSVDLAIVAGGTTPVAKVGDALAYTFIVSNSGADTATGVQVAIPLPPGGGSLVAAAASQGGCAVVGANLVCSLGSLATATGATVSVTLRGTAPGTLAPSASVSSNEPNESTANQKAQAEPTAIVTAKPPQKKKATPKKKGR